MQFVYDHRHDHALQIVDVQKIVSIEEIDENRRRHNIKVLRDLGYIETKDDPWRVIRITTPGTRLLENTAEFNETFPIRYDIPQQTRLLLDTVEELLGGKYDAPLEQFRKAKSFLYESNPPDYPNSIKESVGAVEAISRLMLNEPKKELSKLLAPIREKYLGHPAMAKILESIYAVRGDEPSVAHGAHQLSSLRYPDAEFILNVASSIIIYLIRQSIR